MSAFTDKLHALEAGLKADWSKLEADARAEYEKVLAELKTDAAKIEQQVRDDIKAQAVPLLTQLKVGITQALEAAGPGVQSEVTGVVEKLVAGLAKVLGTAL